MALISIVTPTYNEEDNVGALYEEVKKVCRGIGRHTFEHVFIDNASTDRTVAILRDLAKADRNVKVIVNARNFGPVRSPYYGMLQTRGDATVILAADFEDPPALLPQLVAKWDECFKIAVAVKEGSDESGPRAALRRLYYHALGLLSEIELTKNHSGYGLYDRQVLDIVRRIDDPYPYFRGLLSEIGFESAKVPFRMPARKRGLSKHNFYSLYDFAMLGIVNHSKVPLRLATMFGFVCSLVSLLLAFGYLAAKLLFWNRFSFGLAPILIGFFLFSSVQLFFIGIIGEYLGAVYTQVQRRPLVIERERINWEPDADARP